jgi:hypothetical protein
MSLKLYGKGRTQIYKNASMTYPYMLSKRSPLYVCKVYHDESTILHKNIPWVKLHQYSLKYLYPKLNGYGDNSEVSVKEWELLGVY